jgi:hypothetical protein
MARADSRSAPRLRPLAADFRRAFGEDPGPLLSVGVMTDSDNTRSQARSWYGEVTLH